MCLEKCNLIFGVSRIFFIVFCILDYNEGNWVFFYFRMDLLIIVKGYRRYIKIL